MFDVVAHVLGKFVITKMSNFYRYNASQRIADEVRKSVKETDNIDGFTVYVAM